MDVKLLSFGFGFTAEEVARQNPGWSVLGTRRHVPEDSSSIPDNVSLLTFDGLTPIPDFAERAADITHILLSIPPTDQGDPVLSVMGEQLARLPHLRWVGYLSTTGVYGNLDGGWADEETPYNPSGVRGKRRVDAELAWLAAGLDQGLPVHVFRLPGIYGPGRNQLVSLQQGKARRVVKDGQVFSRIHVSDLASILSASMRQPSPGRAYNVADDLPAPPQDVVSYAAELLGMDPPPVQDFDSADLTPMARSFYSDSKRIRNDRIKSELGVKLAYPTYREGLAALYRRDF
ncbi:SDR family oxidoreductase [Sneathiella chinensis]|uniref:NAD(P)-dependent oxidoreductase n=1 Tax=Sneathiella chinensis TaxID=349750 RepID=A0ABQ5TZJ5_9PROT|nr:SDR family oxidoreductase [Sneathiella chinensis]GLQ05280.1 NAD(P)-dependent oxidoreductase [Sneathiella chinensis]